MYDLKTNFCVLATSVLHQLKNYYLEPAIHYIIATTSVNNFPACVFSFFKNDYLLQSFLIKVILSKSRE